MKDDILDLARYGGPADWELVATDSPTDPLSAAKKTRGELRGLVAAHEEATRQIASDADLTESGKERRLRADAEQRLGSLGKFRDAVRAVEVARDEAARRARESRDPADRVAAAVIGSEIRRYLGEDPLLVQIAYRDALAAGDWDVLDAIENSPTVWPGRPDAETLTELSRERLEHTDPRLGAEVRHLSAAAADVAADLADVESMINGALGGPDELEVLASGG